MRPPHVHGLLPCSSLPARPRHRSDVSQRHPLQPPSLRLALMAGGMLSCWIFLISASRLLAPCTPFVLCASALHSTISGTDKEDPQVMQSAGLKENLWNRIRGSSLTLVEDGTSALEFLKKKIQHSYDVDKDAFFVADLDDVVKKHLRFIKELPQVKPFYAVKCHSSPEVLRTLAILGAGFDCASKTEIKWVLELGVPPTDIIYANPCKQPSHISYAAHHGVTRMTFDCEGELPKVVQHHPHAEMILRIRTDDEGAVSCLSKKFGAPLEICEDLLKKANHLNISVTGVSFHIGSGSGNLKSFSQAIADARHVFDIGIKLGHKMRVLDIGGGFPGHPDFQPVFEEFADVILDSLARYFPEEEGVEIIAEPGRYYMASALIEAVNIIGKKEERDKAGKDRKKFSYYLNDGLMGSFLNGNFCKSDMKLIPLVGKDGLSSSMERFPSTLWGPSCSDKDLIDDDYELPELDVGDWLFFPNMGAYYTTVYTTFNGFLPPPMFYIMSQNVWRLLEKKLNNL